ncbi:MAG: UDP-N-acetylglucosamine 2-epimerase, partial [Planctomycetota bacterium]
RDVKKRYEVADSVPMQVAGRTGRDADVEAIGKGVSRFGRSFQLLRPDWVVVLGDRVEPLAAAVAANIGGRALAHIHGGDRAEGVADESMRHAITKLAHLHLAATPLSAERVRRMGEPDHLVHAIGSPSLDELGRHEPATDDRWRDLGNPEVLLLLHPVGRTDEQEEHAAAVVLESVAGRRVLALYPNLDPGRDGILRAMLSAGENVTLVEHLPRPAFVGTLKRLAGSGGVMLGNSSSGLIEAPALGCKVIDIGPRQDGRERPKSVISCSAAEAGALRWAFSEVARQLDPEPSTMYGDGNAGTRAARLLAEVDPYDPALLRKRIAY